MASDWEVVDEDLGVCVFQDLGDVGVGLCFFVVDVEDFSHVWCYAVHDGCGCDFDVEVGDVGEFGGAVGWGEDGLGEVFSDFVFVDFEGGDEFYVVDVVAAEVYVHESWDGGVWFGVFVVLGALDEGGCAVADAYECDSDFRQSFNLL